MIFCGQEEPLGANRHVLVYDDYQHVYRPCAMTIHRLMRYSFVWQDITTSGALALAAIGQQIVASFDDHAFWVNIWHRPAPGTAKQYALRALKSRRKREGWQVASGDGLEWAWMPLPSTLPSLFWPPVYEYWEGCICVLIASEDVVRTWSQVRQSRSMTVAATTGKIIPSYEWLSWCADNNAHLLYAATHHNDREGMIYVGSQRLPVHTWSAEHLVNTVFVGEEAYKAWQL